MREGVTRARLIATEACRSAENGPEFLAEVRDRLGLQLEIVDRETEALSRRRRLRRACRRGRRIDGPVRHRRRLVGDRLDGARRPHGARARRAWESLRLGVVSLAETFGGDDVTPRDLRR